MLLTFKSDFFLHKVNQVFFFFFFSFFFFFVFYGSLCIILQLSIVEYDPGTHDLKTLSMHYFEQEELKVSQEFFFFFLILYYSHCTVKTSLLVRKRSPMHCSSI